MAEAIERYLHGVGACAGKRTEARNADIRWVWAGITTGTSGNASPYPSDISVAGLGTLSSTSANPVQVTLNGFSHTNAGDVGVVLVGPTGAALLLQDGA